MFTTGSKWFFGVGILSFVLALAYGWSTGGDLLGPLTLGYKGGVGDHLGYGLLVTTGVLSTLLGCLSLVTRDAEPSAQAELAGTDDVPQATAPAHPAYWPVVAAFGAALVVLGLVIGAAVSVIGAILLVAVGVEWMVHAWSDRATGDPDTNRSIRDRVMGPFEVPVLGALVVGGVIFAASRLFLTSSKLGAVWVATGFAVLVLLIAALLAAKPKLSSSLVATVLAVCAIGVLTAGVIAAARGERVIEHHEPHEEEGESLEPHVPDGTDPNLDTTEEEQG